MDYPGLGVRHRRLTPHLFGFCICGAREYCAEQLAHGGASTSVLGYMGIATFWFKSFQTWQSEFLQSAGVVCQDLHLTAFLLVEGDLKGPEVGNPQAKSGAVCARAWPTSERRIVNAWRLVASGSASPSSRKRSVRHTNVRPRPLHPSYPLSLLAPC